MKTIPKSIRLSVAAFQALKALMVKYSKSISEMTSIAIIAYAKKSAAAPIAQYRMIDVYQLLALQAAASDIKSGLSNLKNDLYRARKYNRDPELLKSAYSALLKKYEALRENAERTLLLINKELTLYDIMDPGDAPLLIQCIHKLEMANPDGRTQRQMRDLSLKIYKTLIA